MSSKKEIGAHQLIARSKICRQGFAEGSPLTARSANTSNFTITRFVDQAYKLPCVFCVQGPEIEIHVEVTAYVIADWHLLSSSQARRNGSTAPLPKLLVGTCDAHHFVVSGWRINSAYTYSTRVAGNNGRFGSTIPLRKEICRAVGCQHRAARDLGMRSTVVLIYCIIDMTRACRATIEIADASVSGFTQHKQLDGG